MQLSPRFPSLIVPVGICLALSLVLLPFLFSEGAVTSEAAALTNGPGCADILIGGGFEEEGAPAWEQFSTNFGSPLCSEACGDDGMTAGPRSGEQWMWFGGAGSEGTIAPEIGIITQTVTLEPGTATLSFYLWLGRAGEPEDNFEVLMDGTRQFIVYANSPEYPTYRQTSVDLSAFADGAPHVLTFRGIQTIVGAGFVTNFNLDDATLTSCPVSTPTPTPTQTLEPSATATASATPSATATGTATASATPTSPSATATATVTGTPSVPPSFHLHLPLIRR